MILIPFRLPQISCYSQSQPQMLFLCPGQLPQCGDLTPVSVLHLPGADPVLLTLLFSPCFLCLDPSHPRFQGKLLLRTLVSALMSSTQTLAKVTPPAPPARLVYFLGLIASVVLSPAYFVSLVPSSSPPFLSFFTTSCRRTGTLSCSSAQTRVSQPQDNRHFGSEPPLFGGLSSSLQEVEQHPWPPPTRCLKHTLSPSSDKPSNS